MQISARGPWAVIWIDTRELPGGGVEKSYRWEGERTAPTLVDHRLERVSSIGRPLRIGPFALLPAGPYLYACGGRLYVRADAGLWNWLRRGVPAWSRWYSEMLTCRILATLAVWRLADCEPWRAPCWSDVRWPWRKDGGAHQWLRRVKDLAGRLARLSGAKA